MVAHISMLVIEWIFSSKFSVPDFLLALEITECADDFDVNAIEHRVAFHCQVRLDSVAMHRRGQITARHDMSVRATGQFKLIEHGKILNPGLSAANVHNTLEPRPRHGIQRVYYCQP